MRRDVYIENDSGGFSVLAADAVDAIIEDERSDDFRFVKDYKALLLELYGDDSMPVRIVVDEPLTADEEAQWLARVTWQIDTTDGKMLVMGGFDPDVLSWWKEGSSAEHSDGRGVGAVTASAGSWRVDVYAHVGSMNGRVILDEAGVKAGTEFRRQHPDKPFPLWLGKMLEFSGEEDPGYEELWKDVKGSVAAGKLAVQADGGHAIGFLVHFTRATTPPGEPPEGVWFGRADNSRVPATLPIGLASEAPDPDLTSFTDRLLGRKRPEAERPIATETVEIIGVWAGEPLQPIDGGPVSISPNEIFLLYYMAGLTADSPPRFELWVEPAGAWTPPSPTSDFAVVPLKSGATSIGPVPNTGGWHTWWTARGAAEALANIPDGSRIDLGIARNVQEDAEPKDPAIGRALYSGKVKGGRWEIAEASPRISRDVLEQALAFARDVAVNNRLRLQGPAERKTFEAEAEMNFVKKDGVIWDGDTASLAEPDDRTLIIVGEPIFRARFGKYWPVDVEEPDEDDDDE